jgi:hypothetical protein
VTQHWKQYWDRHAAGVGSDDPFRQVLRTANRCPIGDEAFARAARHVVGLLELEPDHVVLDLCCGNGLLSAAIEPHCARIVAVDFCRRLLRDVRTRTTAKTGGLRPGSSMLVTDIPDNARMWRFHDSREREDARFDLQCRR